MMHKKYHIIFAMALVWATAEIIAFPAVVLADENDLTVVFEQTPLFHEANFLPGTVVSRTVHVTNNTGETKNIITEAINTSDPNHFGNVLHMTIKEDNDVRFDGTLTHFFDEGEVVLSSLAAGAHTTYEFSVSFESDVGDLYQEKSLGFDIIVGFAGDQGITSGDNPPQGGGSGGGGGGGLTIAGDFVKAVEIGETSVVIEWTTSYKSTSRVIYGTTTGLFNFSNPPNYGFPFSTVESDTPANPNGVTLHRVSIPGLTPGATYYYRTVSHASPDTISYEQSFTTRSTADKEVLSFSGSAVFMSAVLPQGTSGELAVGGQKDNAGGSFQIADGGDATSVEINKVTPPPSVSPITEQNNKDTSLIKPSSSFFASLFTALPFSTPWDVIFVLIVVVAVFLIIWKLFPRK